MMAEVLVLRQKRPGWAKWARRKQARKKQAWKKQARICRDTDVCEQRALNGLFPYHK